MGNCCDPYYDATIENTPEWTWEGKTIEAKVIRVIDGDTVDMALQHADSGRIYRYRVRLYGIDAPEMHPRKDNPYREQEREAAQHATMALRTRIEHQRVMATFYKREKFGREMATIMMDDININEWMISEGYAVAYHGGTKERYGGYK